MFFSGKIFSLRWLTSFYNLGKKLDEFKDEYKKKKNKSDIDDLLNQVYFNAKICQHKYMCATWGIRTTTIGILGVFIMFILGIIIVK